jgi:RNA polymerase primary sigma factor
MVRLPLNKINQYSKVNETFLSFVQEFEREPSMEELGELLDLSPDDVAAVLSGAGKHLSVDAPLTDDEGSMSLIDVLSIDDEQSPDLKLMEQSIKDEIKYGIASLSPREIEILKAYYGIDHPKAYNLEEVSEIVGITRERVRQIRDRAIRRLRRSMKTDTFNM